MRTTATLLVILACMASEAHAGRFLNGSFSASWDDLLIEEMDPFTGASAVVLAETPPDCLGVFEQIRAAAGGGKIYFIDEAWGAEWRIATADLCTGRITRVPTRFFPWYLHLDTDDDRLIGVYYTSFQTEIFVAELDPASGILHRLGSVFDGNMQGCAVDDRRNVLYVARKFRTPGGSWETRLLVLDMATDVIVGDHVLAPYPRFFCDSEGIRALDYDPVGDRLLALSNWCLEETDLLAIDPASGAVSTLGTIPRNTGQRATCAFDPVSRLLMISDSRDEQRFTVDVDSGRLVATFPCPQSPRTFWIAYDPDTVPCEVAPPCAIPGPPPADVGDALRVRNHGDPRAADVTAWLDWTLDRGAPRSGEHHHVLAGSEPDHLVRIEGLEPYLGTILLDSTPAATSRPACRYYAVVAANECEDQSRD